MSSASEDPILIPSDDEASDSDDVVLIKEEIEVDNDDVIFLSETKAAAGAVTAMPETESSTTKTSSDKDSNNTETKALNLSSKSTLTALTSQLNLDDANADVNSSMDISTMCNYYLGPLDLSSKADTQGQASGSKGVNNEIVDILDSDLFKSFLFDTDIYNNAHLDSSHTSTGNPLDATVKETKTQGPQGPQSLTSVQCDKVSGSGNEKQTNTGSNNVSAASVQSPDASKCDSLPDLCSKTFNIESILGAPSHSTANTVATSSHSNWSTLTTGTTNTQISDSVIKPLDPQTLLANAISSNNSSSVVSLSNSTPGTNSSQIFLKSSDPMWSSKDDNLVHSVKASLSSFQMDTTSLMPSLSVAGSVTSDQTGLKTFSQTDSSLLNRSSVLQTINQSYSQSGFQTVSQFDTHLQKISVSQSGNSVCSQTGFQTVSQLDSQMQNVTGAQSNSLTGSSFSQGLPGGSQIFSSPSLALSNQSAFRCISSLGDTQNSGNHLKRSLSSSDQTYMYNPLTLPKSQKESYMRSFSTSSLNLWSMDKQKQLASSAVDQGVVDASASSVGGPYQLPPKKQKRCFSEVICTSCKISISGEKSSKCPVGHTTCAKCLEERVKKVLTGKAKESIRCLSTSCDSFYPMSELRLCLPSMVVEILEDEIGQDYKDYFTGMILKSAMDETNSDASIMEVVEDESLGASCFETVPKNVPKKPAETDPELPEHWEPMNEKSAYEMFPLDVNSDEYNQILPLFFASMISQKVEVVKIQRIQNPILWKYYSVKKKEMLLDNEGFGAVNEQQLYHGTDSSVVDAICKKGFDWRVCGKNGTMYGQGTYFAVNASYSHQYTDIKSSRHSRHTTLIPHSTMNIPMSYGMGGQLQSQIQPVVYNKHAYPPNAGLSAINLSNSSNQTPLSSRRYMILPVQTPSPSKYKILPKQVSIRTMSGMPAWPLEEFIDSKKQTTQMFVARVLVGKYSGGSSKLRKPPPLDPKSDPFGKCYDSCVDDIHMPKIFVIFDSAQAYPEYLIEYTYD